MRPLATGDHEGELRAAGAAAPLQSAERLHERGPAKSIYSAP